MLAKKVAYVAHYGQVDKAGVSYINHPKRVAGRMRFAKYKVVAWLHDVVEDTDFTIKDIRRMFGKETANAVDAITHRKGEAWSDYISRVKRNHVAKMVKISDLIDNSNLSRLPIVSDVDVKRQAKYNRALMFLMDMDGK